MASGSPCERPRRVLTTPSRTAVSVCSARSFPAAKFTERNGIADADQNIQRPALQQFPGVTLHVHVAVPPDAEGGRRGPAVRRGGAHRQLRRSGQRPPDIQGERLLPASCPRARQQRIATTETEARDCHRWTCPQRTAQERHLERDAARHFVGGVAHGDPLGSVHENGALQAGKGGYERQRDTSDLATNETGATAERTGMSSHDV